MRSTGGLGVSRFEGAWVCGRVTRVLAVLFAVVVLLGFAPSASALEEGSITGRVTSATVIVDVVTPLWSFAVCRCWLMRVIEPVASQLPVQPASKAWEDPSQS